MLVTVRAPRNYYNTVKRLTREEGWFFGITDESGNSFVFKLEGKTCLLVASSIPGSLFEVIANYTTICVCMAVSQGCTQLAAEGEPSFDIELHFIDLQSRPIVMIVNPVTKVSFMHERSHALLYQRIKLVSFDETVVKYLYQAVPDPTGYDPEKLLLRGKIVGVSSYFPLSMLNVDYQRQAQGAASRGKKPRSREWISRRRAHLASEFPDYDYSQARPHDLRSI